MYDSVCNRQAQRPEGQSALPFRTDTHCRSLGATIAAMRLTLEALRPVYSYRDAEGYDDMRRVA